MPSTRPLERTATPGIYRRGNSYVVTFKRPDGRQGKRFAPTLTAARALKASLTADVGRGEYREQSRLTFAEYAAAWIDGYTGRTGRGIRPATLADYRRAIEQDAIPYLGRLRLAQIEPRHVKQFAASIGARGVSPNTVRLTLAPLRALFATAVEEGLLRANPCAGVRVPRPERLDDDAHAKALEPAEVENLIAAVRCPKCDRLTEPTPGCAACQDARLLISVLAQTGLRIGELAALRWGDLDLGHRRLHVRRRWYRGTYAPPKSRYGRREVPLSTDLARQLWQRQGASDALVFATSAGTPLDYRNLASRVLKPAGCRAGVPWVHWHVLRHTAVTSWVRAGWNPKAVQTCAGHHSVAFSLDIYASVFAADLPDADTLGGSAPELPTGARTEPRAATV